MRKAKFYEDDILQLTDETFGKTLNMTEFLLAFFYTPLADDVSFLVQPIIADVNANIGEFISYLPFL